MSEATRSKHLGDLLGELDQYVDKDFTNAVTLPRGCYTSEEFFELEREKVFEDAWLCVGHELDFPDTGDFFGVKVCNEAMVIVKGEDGQIRALSSVCRHRYARIIEHGQRGNDAKIQCPYHRWTYGLDGKLNNALFLEKNECFDKARLGLPEYRLEIWNGFIFVNLNDDAAPLAPQLEEPNEQLSIVAEQVRANDFQPTEYYHATWKCNWKLFQENNSEGYHHMGVHVDTLNKAYPSSLIPFNEADSRGGEDTLWTGYTSPIDASSEAGKQMNIGFTPGEMGQSHQVLDVLDVFPSNAFTIARTGFGWYTLLPTAADEVTYIAGYYSNLNAAERQSQSRYPSNDKYKNRPMARVLDEDGQILPAIQEALTHGKKVEPVGCLSWQEGGLVKFYRQLHRRLRAD